MIAETLRETAYAKINLALHVRERLPDGYHRIETLFAFVEDGDALTVAPAGEVTLSISGPFGDGLSSGEDNLVLRAAKELQLAFEITEGAALHLDKRLPIASGIGGGSADAAATLRLLKSFWKIENGEAKILDIAADLGADVPACYLSQTCFGEGTGADLQPIAGMCFTGRPALLVNPNVALETRSVFAGWDGEDRGSLMLADALEITPDWRNDLTVSASKLVPDVAEVLDALSAQENTTFVRMSGSGATCFALFASGNARDTAAQTLSSEHPKWWILPSALR